MEQNSNRGKASSICRGGSGLGGADDKGSCRISVGRAGGSIDGHPNI
jgi:hypothetical protein